MKRLVILDVVLLSGLYTLRIFVGGEATGIAISKWLLVFSTFFFMGLALVKRYAEVAHYVVSGRPNEFGRTYIDKDLPALLGLGIASSFMSILVLSLYMNSPQVEILYQHPDRLWGLVPLCLYWCGRLWIMAARKEILDDPVDFAMFDKVTWLIALIAVGMIQYAV